MRALNNLDFLAIDTGNSTTKMAIFYQGAFQQNISLDQAVTLPLNTFALGASVSGLWPELPFPIYNVAQHFQSSFFFDMAVDYSETIGIDRLCFAYHIFKKYSSPEPVMIIDSGTFTTIDLLGPQGLMGGYIFPGIKLLEKTFHSGHLLGPLFKSSPSPRQEIPHNSLNAMNSAIFNMYLGAIKEIMGLQKISRIFYTGGETSYLENILSTIPVDTKNIHQGVLQGLGSMAQEIGRGSKINR